METTDRDVTLMNKPDDLLSSRERPVADLSVQAVDGATDGVLGIRDLALTNTEERGDIAAGTIGDGCVGDSGLSDGLDLELQGVGGHEGIPSKAPQQYMHSSIDCNALQHLLYAVDHSDNRRMHKRTIKDNLSALMTRSGLTPTALGRETGINQSIIQRIASGETKRPRDDNVFELAKFFGVTTDQMHGRAPIDFDALPLRRDDILRRAMPAAGEQADEFVELPFIRRITLTGELRRESVEMTGELRKISQADLDICGVERGHAAFFRTQGDTMAPVFIDGSIAGINMAATDVTDGKVYAVQINDEIWIKRAYRIPGGGLRLSSYDPEVDDLRFTVELMRSQQVAIVGRVFHNSTCYL